MKKSTALSEITVLRSKGLLLYVVIICMVMVLCFSPHKFTLHVTYKEHCIDEKVVTLVILSTKYDLK